MISESVNRFNISSAQKRLNQCIVILVNDQPYAVGKQPSITLINFGITWMLK